VEQGKQNRGIPKESPLLEEEGNNHEKGGTALRLWSKGSQDRRNSDRRGGRKKTKRVNGEGGKRDGWRSSVRLQEEVFQKVINQTDERGLEKEYTTASKATAGCPFRERVIWEEISGRGVVPNADLWKVTRGNWAGVNSEERTRLTDLRRSATRPRRSHGGCTCGGGGVARKQGGTRNTQGGLSWLLVFLGPGEKD